MSIVWPMIESPVGPAVTEIIPSFGPALHPPPAIAFTTAQDGNWHDPATWAQAEGYVPQEGDTITVNHVVTVAQNAKVGNDEGVNCIHFTYLQTGRIIVAAGKTLEVRDNIFDDNGSGMQFEAGAKFHGNTTGYMEYVCNEPPVTNPQLRFNGTQSQKCEMKAIGAGKMGMRINGARTGGCRIEATWTNFENCGDASNIDPFPYLQLGTNPTTQPYLVEDCTFNNCYAVANYQNSSDHGSDTGRVEFNRCKWTNSNESGGIPAIFRTFSKFGMTFKISDCDFDGVVDITHPDDAEFTGNVFRKGFNRSVVTSNLFRSGLLGAKFQNNTVVFTANDVHNFSFGEEFEDNLFIYDGVSNNPHLGSIEAQTGAVSVRRNIFWSTATAGSSEGDGFFFGPPDSGTQAGNLATFEHNIVLPNGNGPTATDALSFTLFSVVSSSAIFSVKAHRNTVFCGGANGGINLGETQATAAGCIDSIDSNLFVGNAQGTPNAFKVADIGLSVEDTWSPSSLVDYNGGYRLAAGSKTAKGIGPFTFSGSDDTGANDVDDTDPLFVDWSRTPATWAGDLATALDWLSFEDTTAGHDMAGLQAYIRAGWTPTETDFQGSGLGGVDIGSEDI